MRRKFLNIMSVSLALLMSVSCVAPYVSTSVYASDAIQVETSSDGIQIEDEKKDAEATVSIGESSENGIVIENTEEYVAGEEIPLQIKASNTGKEEVDLRVYFWDYDKTLPKEKTSWSQKLKTASSDIQVSEFKEKKTISVKLKEDKDTKNVDATFVTEKDKKSKKVTACYLSLTMPAKTSLDTVFHVKCGKAKTETVIPVMVSGAEKDFGDAVQLKWRKKDIEVEDTTKGKDIVVESKTDDKKKDSDTKDIEVVDNTKDITVSESKTEEHFLDTEKGVDKLNASDFTSARLIVLADDKNIIIDTEHLIGSYDNLYLLQYQSAKQAMNAYVYYQSHATAVEPDRTLDAADEKDVADTDAAELPVTEETNPIRSLGEEEDSEVTQKSDKVIALIDTGVNESDNVIDRVSLIDDTLVSNGHGDKMLEAIVSQDADAKILSIRVMGDDGKGTVSSVIAGMEYAINQNVDIINLSMFAKSNLANSVIASEIQKAVDAGIEVVGAAGNDGADVKDYMPGSVDAAWIIGACDAQGVRLEKSNYGSTVDYNVVADSTSEAAAKFTGYISEHGSSEIDGDGMIYKGTVVGGTGTIETNINGKLYLASTLILKVGDDFDPKTYLDDLSDYIPEGADVKLTYSDVNVKKVGSYTTVYDVTVDEDTTFTVKRPVYVGKTEDAKPGDYCISILTDTVDGINANITSVWYNAGDTVEFTLSPVNKDAEIQDVKAYKMLNEGNSNAVFGDEIECKTVKMSKLTDEEKASNVDSKAKKYRFVMPESDVLIDVTTSNDLMQTADTSGGSDELTSFVVNQTTKVCCYYNPKVSAIGPRATTYRTVRYSWKNGNGVTQTSTIACYCIQPSKSAPLVSGDNKFSSTSGNVVAIPDGNVMSKAMYYLYGGPMWGYTIDGVNMKSILDTYAPTAGHPSNYKGIYNGSTDKDGYYAMTHLILGYLYNGENNEAVWNKADDGQTGDVWNATGKAFLKNVKTKLASLPSPTVYLRTYEGDDITDSTIASNKFYVGTAHPGTWESPWVKYIAPYANYMKTSLPTGVIMHYRYTDSANKTVEKEVTGSVGGLPGGTQFYLIIDPSKVTGPFKMTMTSTFAVNFEAWRITKSGNYQDLGFGYHTGNKNTQLTFDFPKKAGLSIQKESANTAVTNNNANYSLKDAVYGVYTDANCTKKTLEIKTNENGYAATANDALTAGTYYVKETKASKGFALDTKVYTYKLTAGTSASKNKQTSKEPVRGGKINLVKKSTLPEMTNNNACYSLAGAEYTVYTDSACKNSTGKVITTDENGKGAVSDLGFGTYYVKETKASKGFELDTKVYTAMCNEGTDSVTEVTLNSNEVPGNDPASITITKIWHGEQTGTIPSLEGTQFTIKYYAGDYEKSTLPSKATRTWVLEVKYRESIGKYTAALTDNYLVKGSDSLYKDEDNLVVLPYGTYTIQETKAAPGYTLEGSFTDQNGNKVSPSDVYLTKVLKKGDAIKLDGGNEFSAEDTPRKSTIRLKKYASNGKTALEGVEFELKDTDGNLIAKKTTDKNGELVFDDLYPNKYVITETKTANSDYQILAEPIEVECPMRFTQQEVDDKNMDTTHLVYDENEGVYYAFNQTYEITDDYKFKIPQTGGNGMWKYGFAGMGMLAAMCYGYVVYRMMRKRRQL